MVDLLFTEKVRKYGYLIAEGGPPALSGLYDLTAHRLVRLAVTITRNQHDAEDAVQSALVSIVSRPLILAKADNPWHYLLRMVRNESLVVLRKKRRWTFGMGLSDLLTSTSVDEVEQAETHRAVWLALRSLPTDQREVVVLKIWEGLTFQEIADVLDCTLPTAASRYRYALQKLTTKLRVFGSEACHDT